MSTGQRQQNGSRANLTLFPVCHKLRIVVSFINVSRGKAPQEWCCKKGGMDMRIKFQLSYIQCGITLSLAARTVPWQNAADSERPSENHKARTICYLAFVGLSTSEIHCGLPLGSLWSQSQYKSLIVFNRKYKTEAFYSKTKLLFQLQVVFCV